ncbi:MAG: CAP domain-containing protein [Psychrobacter sp.]|nr:CAP domain-containing protein [Psychrobacter sp.]
MPYLSHSFVLRGLTAAILATMLAACGGGGGGSDSGSKPDNKPNPKPDTTIETTVDTTTETTQTTETTTDTTTTTVTGSPVVEQNDGTGPNTNPAPAPSGEEAVLSPYELAVYNRLNLRRSACGFGGLANEPRLTQAADNHVNYLLYMNKNSDQAFQGHYERLVDAFSGNKNPYFTGESVVNRIATGADKGAKAQPVNYAYQTVAENLSYLSFNDTYFKQMGDEKVALSGINGLLAAPYHMASLLSPNFTEIGVSYGRDTVKVPMLLSDGSRVKGQGSVLEMVLATPYGKVVQVPSQVVNYPCEGVTGTQYELKHESPNPFGADGRDLGKNPIGQPIYILGNGNLSVTNYKMTDAANQPIALQALTAANDKNKILEANQVILMPLTPLKPAQSYRVTYTVSVNGAASEVKTFTFTTKAA